MRNIPITRPCFDDYEKQMIAEALDSGWVAQGPRVAEFEKQIAAHEHVNEGVATTSCTTALHLAMIAEGLREGMDAIAPAFTFVATENAIVQTGAVPVMVDVNRSTFNINVELVEQLIENEYVKKDDKLINRTTGNQLWGIVPVHEFGLCCEIDEINRIANEHGLKVIEDAACALGSAFKDKHPGDFGNTACVSFHPRKSITTGEGGMILTNDKTLAIKLRELRSHGSTVSADERDKGKGFLLPEMIESGFNYRMTDIQGALGLSQVKKLDRIIEEKRRLVNIYNGKINRMISGLITPVEPAGYYHTYQSYVCMLNSEYLGFNSIEEGGQYRNNLLSALADIGIATRQGTHAVHMLGYYRNRFGYVPTDYTEAYACDHLSIALPLYYGLKEDDIGYVVDSIYKIMERI